VQSNLINTGKALRRSIFTIRTSRPTN
jgi:hypothetical protein